jgi:hypothetical protein
MSHVQDPSGESPNFDNPAQSQSETVLPFYTGHRDWSDSEADWIDNEADWIDNEADWNSLADALDYMLADVPAFIDAMEAYATQPNHQAPVPPAATLLPSACEPPLAKLPDSVTAAVHTNSGSTGSLQPAPRAYRTRTGGFVMRLSLPTAVRWRRMEVGQHLGQVAQLLIDTWIGLLTKQGSAQAPTPIKEPPRPDVTEEVILREPEGKPKLYFDSRETEEAYRFLILRHLSGTSDDEDERLIKEMLTLQHGSEFFFLVKDEYTQSVTTPKEPPRCSPPFIRL